MDNTINNNRYYENEEFEGSFSDEFLSWVLQNPLVSNLNNNMALDLSQSHLLQASNEANLENNYADSTSYKRKSKKRQDASISDSDRAGTKDDYDNVT